VILMKSKSGIELRAQTRAEQELLKSMVGLVNCERVIAENNPYVVQVCLSVAESHDAGKDDEAVPVTPGGTDFDPFMDPEGFDHG